MSIKTEVEVLELFAEAQNVGAVGLKEGLEYRDQGAALRNGTFRERREQWSQYASNALYMPPWWDECGEYGPTSEAALSRATATYHEGRAGGGLWDHETALAEDAAKTSREAAKDAERFDGEKMRVFVERHSAQISARLLDVYQAFYIDRQSKGAAARRFGISKQTVEGYLKSLRAMAKGKARRR